MKGKRWELPQKFRTIYWQNFALTASIVMLTLALLGASFFALSYAYAADERSDEMAQKASVVARLVASYASSGDVRDMREMAGVAASMTDVDFLVCSTEGSVLLTTDENLVDHVLTVPSDVMETALSGERYSARTTLGGIYESKRFVVGVPIESDGIAFFMLFGNSVLSYIFPTSCSSPASSALSSAIFGQKLRFSDSATSAVFLLWTSLFASR